MSIGTWHGDTTVEVTLALPTSVVDPDLPVRPAGAEPARTASKGMAAWETRDVLLVVEVSDETPQADLTEKARTCAAAGFPVHRVVSREVVHEHKDPIPFGHRNVRRYRPGDRLPVPRAGATMDVGAVIGAPR